jgi:SAM-dependent methyltransferase
MYSDGKTPNFRERLSCSICSLNNRQRYIVSYLQEEYKNNKKIYMYEQVTAVYNAVKIFAQDNLIGSEFINRNLKSGSVYDGILHENAEYLSFGDEKFDIIVSNDVFEHVNDVQKCFNEAHRVLKTNGKLIMSVPFYPDKDKTIRRAEIINNEIVYYTDAIYHGNPMSEDGSLVFFDFGWDILHMIKMAGFKEAYVKAYYSKEYGYLGRIPLVFEAIKS